MENSVSLQPESSEKNIAPTNGRSVVRDFIFVTAGTLFAAFFGVIQVFVVPRLISVEEYGYWRLFVLYAGYAGLLHFGFADGALLNWAGKEITTFRSQIPSAIRFMLVQHALVFLVGVAGCLFVFQGNPELRTIFIAVFAFAGIMNVLMLLQFTLQASRNFLPVALATALPVGCFVFLAFIAARFNSLNSNTLIGLYFVSYAGVLIFLWNRVSPFQTAAQESAAQIGLRFIAIGWPVVLANVAYGIVQSADRLVLSTAGSIVQFAHYSLASSTMFVPITVVLAVSRVFLPHFAAQSREGHPGLYAQSSRVILLVCAVLMPYYSLVDGFVRHFLPKYVPSLPVARILVLSIVFFASIQILQMTVFNLYERQRRLLVGSIFAVAVGLTLAALGVHVFHSLTLVAAAQILTAGIWWAANEWQLRELTGENWRQWTAYLLIYVWTASVHLFATSKFVEPISQIGVYELAGVLPILFFFKDELRIVASKAAQLGWTRNKIMDSSTGAND